MSSERLEVLVIPGQGRWVWVEALSLVDFYSTGSRSPAKIAALDGNQNNLDGALRKALRLSLGMDFT